MLIIVYTLIIVTDGLCFRTFILVCPKPLLQNTPPNPPTGAFFAPAWRRGRHPLKADS